METQKEREDKSMLLRPAEAALELRISRSKLYELLARGELPGAIRIGASLRVSRVVLEAWIADQAAGHDAA